MKKEERRQHTRFPVIESMREEVMMYISPPLIQDPVPVIIHDLSAGGMTLETAVPIPSRFLFTIIFKPPSMNKITAEGKAVHVLKDNNRYKIGVSFTKIDIDVIKKITAVATDVQKCDKRIKKNGKKICTNKCRYRPICHRKEKVS